MQETRAEDLEFIADRERHLVCEPYSIKNLHIMEKALRIHKCWFHGNHYDIPQRRIEEILSKCKIVTPREIVRIIRSGS